MNHRLLIDIMTGRWAHDFTRGMSVLPFVLRRLTSDSIEIAPDEEREKAKPASSEHPMPGVRYHFLQGTILKYRGSIASERALNLADVDEKLIAFAKSSDRVLLLHWDSPGGIVYGCQQTANLIAEIQAETGKRIYSYTDTMCCSGAQWAAAPSYRCYADSFGDFGSVGVYTVYEEAVKWFEENGIKIHVFRSGKHKAAGHPALELDQEEQDRIQAEVDSDGEKFRADIRKYRGNIDQEYLEGQPLHGDDLMASGLIDGIVENIFEVYDIIESDNLDL